MIVQYARLSEYTRQLFASLQFTLNQVQTDYLGIPLVSLSILMKFNIHLVKIQFIQRTARVDILAAFSLGILRILKNRTEINFLAGIKIEAASAAQLKVSLNIYIYTP